MSDNRSPDEAPPPPTEVHQFTYHTHGGKRPYVLVGSVIQWLTLYSDGGMTIEDARNDLLAIMVQAMNNESEWTPGCD